MTFETFMVSNPKTSRDAANRIKKWKSTLKKCKKNNIVVMLPSIDPSTNKKIQQVIEENLKPDVATVITFSNTTVAKEFLAKIYAETVDDFPAYFKINDSDSSVNHVTLISEITPAMENINLEIEKYKDQMIDPQNKLLKNSNRKNLMKDIKKINPNKLLNKGKDIAKDVLNTKPKDIGKGIKGIFKKKK